MPITYPDITEEQRKLFKAAGIALAIELAFFLALGLWHLPLFNNFNNALNSSQYVDVQILQLPANAHLSGASAVNDEDEIVFNPKKKHPKVIINKPQNPSEQNQVNQGPVFGPTHGPIALYSPAPVIPVYLRNQNLKTNVVIEFLITAQGQVTPRLLDSSGNEELDAIALDAVKKWQFKPAANNNVPIDSRTRLRILFEVY